MQRLAPGARLTCIQHPITTPCVLIHGTHVCVLLVCRLIQWLLSTSCTPGGATAHLEQFTLLEAIFEGCVCWWCSDTIFYYFLLIPCGYYCPSQIVGCPTFYGYPFFAIFPFFRVFNLFIFCCAIALLVASPSSNSRDTTHNHQTMCRGSLCHPRHVCTLGGTIPHPWQQTLLQAIFEALCKLPHPWCCLSVVLPLPLGYPWGHLWL